jgi:acyl-CoA oxidase
MLCHHGECIKSLPKGTEIITVNHVYICFYQQYTNMSPLDISNLQNQMETLLSQLRPNVVGIVDGFDFCDDILRSALGAWDGQVYERLLEAASKSPLNKDPVNESFQKYLKPFLKSSL